MQLCVRVHRVQERFLRGRGRVAAGNRRAGRDSMATGTAPAPHAGTHLDEVRDGSDADCDGPPFPGFRSGAWLLTSTGSERATKSLP